jgi:hypothetical protein
MPEKNDVRQLFDLGVRLEATGRERNEALDDCGRGISTPLRFPLLVK